MKKFLVLFLTPVSILEKWMNTDPAVRKETEDKMKSGWNAWIDAHKENIVEMPAGAGKTKSISSAGIIDSKNDVMMFGIVQAESHDAAAEMFVGHPHLGIPEATIEVMTINHTVASN